MKNRMRIFSALAAPALLLPFMAAPARAGIDVKSCSPKVEAQQIALFKAAQAAIFACDSAYRKDQTSTKTSGVYSVSAKACEGKL
jgi:hypothetical protein